MDILKWFLILCALSSLASGAATVTQATLGVGLIGMGCLLAVLARMVQAHQHHKDVMAAQQQTQIKLVTLLGNIGEAGQGSDVARHESRETA